MPTTLSYDEQLQQLKEISEEKAKIFQFYDDEVEIEIEEGFDIHPDLIKKLELAEKELNQAVFNYNTMLVYCVRNKIDTPNYWEKMGFTMP